MQIFVKFEVFDTITSQRDVAGVRTAVGRQVEKMIGSGKVLASGCFTDARAGFFLLEVEGSEDLFDLLGPAILDHCRVETHPVMSLAKLGEFFKREALH